MGCGSSLVYHVNVLVLEQRPELTTFPEPRLKALITYCRHFGYPSLEHLSTHPAVDLWVRDGDEARDFLVQHDRANVYYINEEGYLMRVTRKRVRDPEDTTPSFIFNLYS